MEIQKKTKSDSFCAKKTNLYFFKKLVCLKVVIAVPMIFLTFHQLKMDGF